MESSKKILLSTIAIAIVIVLLSGVTFAFFNYTRTGASNVIKTGRIYFNSEQNGTLNMTNIFPLTSTQASSAQLDMVTVGIVGDTIYTDGEEFEITLTGLNNTVNGKEIPINYIATYTAATGWSIGESSETYFTARESKDANIYKLNATGKVVDGKQVLTGYIKNGTTGISGTITIKAYIDADRIAISDTYYENAPTPRPTAPSDEYGTTTEWVDGRVVLTTEEWNSLSTNGISFKIKAESNEGVWTSPQIESCIGCKFMYFVVDTNDISTVKWTTWNIAGETPTEITSGLYDNYEELIEATGKNHFLGVKLNKNNEVTNVYSCGVKSGTPFCIEGTVDGSKYADNQTLLQGANLYNNTCTVNGDTTSGSTVCGPWDNTGSLSALATTNGSVNVGEISYREDACSVNPVGIFGCE